jgi:hypothetical protein
MFLTTTSFKLLNATKISKREITISLRLGLTKIVVKLELIKLNFYFSQRTNVAIIIVSLRQRSFSLLVEGSGGIS